MKKLIYQGLFSLVILGLSIMAKAQESSWDSTYRPAAYLKKLEAFQKEGINRKDVVFLGNSITAGTDWAKLLALPNAKNRGISGDITFGVLERLDQIILAKPSKVFVLIGINDISRNIPDSVILGNYKKIIQRIKEGSKKTKIYFTPYCQSMLRLINSKTIMVKISIFCG